MQNVRVAIVGAGLMGLYAAYSLEKKDIKDYVILEAREIPPGGKAALFGFLGVPADVRSRVSEEELIAACRTQFVRLFGSQAENPEAEFIKDWAKEIYTATETDQRSSGDHPMPALSPSSGAWANRVTGIGSEWSREFTGYLAGAIDAVNRGLDSF